MTTRWAQRLRPALESASRSWGLITAHLYPLAQMRKDRRRHRKTCAVSIGVIPALLLSIPAAWPSDLPPRLSEEDYIVFDPNQAALGQQLFYDNVLSGNRNINCGTCHHPRFGTSDGLSLGIGEGGVGAGLKRTPGTGEDAIRQLIPRNAPGLWNLGAKDIRVLFHDGRLGLSQTSDRRFDIPDGKKLPDGLNSLLAAQVVLTLMSPLEMAGDPGENEIADAVYNRMETAWALLAARVTEVYGNDFVKAFPHVTAPSRVTITDIANALAAFIAIEWESRDSAFDAYLRGYDDALSSQQKRGLALFYGKANCARCHSGALFSDQKYHALGLPAFGPGHPSNPLPRDTGRMAVSDDPADAYRFRTPMLRNVSLTAPYGHNGAYPTLESIIRHHLNPDAALAAWDADMAVLPDFPWRTQASFAISQNAEEMVQQAQARDIVPMVLKEDEIDALVAFLNSLTGTNSVHNPPFGIP